MTKPKYRTLTMEELTAIEKQFVEFLVINGITANDWEKIKKEDKAKAERLIDLFSDVVFEEVLRKTEYLEHRSKNELKVFHCLEDKMVLVGMRAEGEEVDMNDPEFIKKASVNAPENVSYFHSEKSYSEEREQELFKMTQKGCMITDGKLYRTLCLAMADK